MAGGSGLAPWSTVPPSFPSFTSSWYQAEKEFKVEVEAIGKVRPPPIGEIKQHPHHAPALIDLVPFPPPSGATALTHMGFMDFIPTPKLPPQRPNQL